MAPYCWHVKPSPFQGECAFTHTLRSSVCSPFVFAAFLLDFIFLSARTWQLLPWPRPNWPRPYPPVHAQLPGGHGGLAHTRHYVFLNLGGLGISTPLSGKGIWGLHSKGQEPRAGTTSTQAAPPPVRCGGAHCPSSVRSSRKTLGKTRRCACQRDAESCPNFMPATPVTSPLSFTTLRAKQPVFTA